MFYLSSITQAYPFLSLLFSIILMIGLYQIGEIILYNKQLNSIFNNISEINYQKILVAINLIMILLLPVVLFFKYSKEIIYILSISIFLFGIIKIIRVNKKILDLKNIEYLGKIDLEKILFLVIFLGYFLITFSPINHADSLDYHISGSEYIFKTGNLPTSLENFTNLLIGSGEVFMSLGFFFGAEQFGNLIQFSGLLSLFGLIKKFNNNKYFFLLLICSSPVLIFLASSPKPQLFHIASIAILFVIVFIKFNFFKNSKKYFFYVLLLSNIFIINSINAKFSFILSGSIIYIILIVASFKRNCVNQMIVANSIFLLLFFISFGYWKSLVWGGNFYNYIINPLPMHLEGVSNFYGYLQNYSRETLIYNIFIPKNFSQFTNAMGIGVVIFIYFFLIKKKITIYFVPILTFFILINYFFGQPSSRFFFEIYIWMILLICSFEDINISSKLKIIFYPQFIISIIAIWYGVTVMSYGFINENLRDRVMRNTANGYSLFEWSNSVLKKKSDRVLSMHRSISLSKNEVYATNFINWLRNEKERIRPYHIKNLLKEHDGDTYLLTFGNMDNTSIFGDCIDYLYKKKENVGSHVGRNPFNKKTLYDGYIFKLKNINKTKCFLN